MNGCFREAISGFWLSRRGGRSLCATTKQAGGQKMPMVLRFYAFSDISNEADNILKTKAQKTDFPSW
jgi:hypothetical protein